VQLSNGTIAASWRFLSPTAIEADKKEGVSAF